MIPVATAVTMSAQGAAQRLSDAEGALSSQFDAEIILATGCGKTQTRAFPVKYGDPALAAVVLLYQTAGYVVTVGPNCGFPPRNPRRNTVQLSW